MTPGTPFPFGATPYTNGVNFSIYIHQGEKVSLCLFDQKDLQNPHSEFPLDPSQHRSGNIWHIFIPDIPLESIYAFRVKLIGEKEEEHLLLDPYAKNLTSASLWNDRTRPYTPRGKVTLTSDFNWEGIKAPRILPKDMIIYEMHVRGFTKDSSSQTTYPGTYLGVIEKIPYLKELGINVVEFLPLFEFNETEVMQKNPSQAPLCNYFGYSTQNFFTPMLRYASQIENNIIEFKKMVKELHRNGIEVILDVVFNHTGEGDAKGPTLSFKGLDKHTYYIIDPQGNYLNFSGTGNTFNCNNPIAWEFILNSLRYWVQEMHIDGFRFDLASIFTRGEDGGPINHAPIVEAISKDPFLADTKLIAEAWDAAGLYQVGGFYPGTRWSEWNGRYRDVVRQFIKGDSNQKTAFVTAISGSQDMYGWRGSPTCSVNFVTAHDGFSLADLVSYNEKHNLDNGEENRDGFDHNYSWNHGIEGHTRNQKIIELRERQIRNLMVALMVSHGIPMVLMGDEYAHTREGNNNTWCQDNKLNWFLWDQLDRRPGFLRFYRALIQFRKNTPLLTRDSFLTDKDVTWHGITPFKPEWEVDNHYVAFTLNIPDQYPELYIGFNAGPAPISVTLPPPGEGRIWEWMINTHNKTPEDFFEEGKRPRATTPTVKICSYTAVVLRSVK